MYAWTRYRIYGLRHSNGTNYVLTKVVYKQLENDMSGIGVKISDTTKRLRGFNIQISNPTI